MSPIRPFRLSLSLNFIYVESKIPTGVNWVWRCQKNKTALVNHTQFCESFKLFKDIPEVLLLSHFRFFQKKKKEQNKTKEIDWTKCCHHHWAFHQFQLPKCSLSVTVTSVASHLWEIRSRPYIWVSGEFSSSQILLLRCCTVALWTLQAHFRQRWCRCRPVWECKGFKSHAGKVWTNFKWVITVQIFKQLFLGELLKVFYYYSSTGLFMFTAWKGPSMTEAQMKRQVSVQAIKTEWKSWMVSLTTVLFAAWKCKCPLELTLACLEPFSYMQ